MIIHAPILTAPLILVAWALDMYLFLCAVRLVSGLLRHPAAAKVGAALRPVTDPGPRALENWLRRKAKGTPRPWVPWLIVCLGAVVLRQALVALVIAVS